MVAGFTAATTVLEASATVLSTGVIIAFVLGLVLVASVVSEAIFFLKKEGGIILKLAFFFLF